MKDKTVISVVAMVCGTAIVLYAMTVGMCNSEMLMLVLIALFGGEQVLKGYIKSEIEAGRADALPPLLLTWYNATGV